MMHKTFLALGFLLAPLATLQAVTPAEGQACPVLDPSEVAYVVPAVGNAQIKVREKPYPSCSFVWPSNLQVQKTVGGRTFEYPGEGRLTLTLAAVKSSEEDWRRVINSYGGQELLDVPAVGERAVWSAQRHQLSVLSGAHVIHVALENPDEPDAEYESAVRLALLLADMYE